MDYESALKGSTRQQWNYDAGKLQVFGHDWLGVPTSSCIGNEIDASFEGFLLKDCGEDYVGSFQINNVSNNDVGFVKFSLEGEDDECLSIKSVDNGSYGARGGAQVGLAPCNETSVRMDLHVLIILPFD